MNAVGRFQAQSDWCQWIAVAIANQQASLQAVAKVLTVAQRNAVFFALVIKMHEGPVMDRQDILVAIVLDTLAASFDQRLHQLTQIVTWIVIEPPSCLRASKHRSFAWQST